MIYQSICEFRGLEEITSQKGNKYYNIHLEDKDGRPECLYVPSRDMLPMELKKGDMVKIACDRSQKWGKMSFDLVAVDKVNK